MPKENNIDNSLIPLGSAGLVRVSNSIEITNKILKNHEDRSVAENFKSVKIGNQEWMTKNLDVDCYANGEPIPQVQNSDEWENLKTGAWCYYDNDSKNGKIYGKIYNWYIFENLFKIIPPGFKLPSKEDWEILKQNSKSIDYSAYREYPNWWGATHIKSITGWNKRNGDNLYNFNALPCGYRTSKGEFLGHTVGFWASSLDDNGKPYFMFISDSENLAFLSRNSDKNLGYYIRCVKI